MYASVGHQASVAGAETSRVAAGAAIGLVTSNKQVGRDDKLSFVGSIDSRLRRMRSGVVLSARLIQEVTLTSAAGRRAAMVTLTYKPGVEWKPRDVSSFLDAVKKWAVRRGFVLPYVWVAELQKRGAVHYHVLLWLPKGLTLPKPDKQGWWAHGMTKIEWARRAVSYVTKYASKGLEPGETSFPRGLRLWSGGGLCLDAREWRSWLRLPNWLRRLAVDRQRLTRLPNSGGLWIAEVSGECWRSPYEFVKCEVDNGRVLGVWLRERGTSEALGSRRRVLKTVGGG